MYKYCKRFLDVGISLIALILLSPIMLVFFIWLSYTNKGAGVFYLQERPGKDGKPFKIIKLKTMTDERDADGNLLPDEQRITNAGRIARSTSVDELPQLINVIKGEMSLVGPRPLTIYYSRLYDDSQKRRLEVRPGITGWAQVHGRSHCKLSEKFKLDVWYVDHCSFLLDIKIVWMTIINVFLRKDIGEGNRDMAAIDDLGFEGRIKRMIAAEKSVLSGPVLLDREQCMRHKNRLAEFYYSNIRSCSYLDGFSYGDAELKIDSMIEHVTDGSAMVFGMFDSTNLIGYVWAYEHPFREEVRVYVSEIHVDETYRNRGVGKQLLQAVERMAKGRGIGALYIHAEGDNEGAIRLYGKEGFVVERVQLRKAL